MHVVNFFSFCALTAQASNRYISSTDSTLSLSLSSSSSDDELSASLESVLRIIEQSPTLVIPLLTDTYELVDKKYDQTGKFGIGLPVARTRTSTVFGIRKHPEDVVKYQVDCSGRGFHSLTRDFHFLKLLEPAGISPRAKILSGEQPIVTVGTSRVLSFKMDDEDWEDCLRKGYPPVRYMIIERMGQSVHEFISKHGTLSLRDSARLGVHLMRTIQRLHSLGFIHGDIHHGNVLFHPGNNIDRGVVLIDFEFAKRLDTNDVKLRPIPTHPHALHTPWVFQGDPPSYRDDVFRAVEVLAFAMVGHSLYTSIEEAASSLPRRDFMMMKLSSAMLDHVERTIPLNPLAKRNLDALNSYVQGLRLHEEVDFDGIVASLEALY